MQTQYWLSRRNESNQGRAGVGEHVVNSHHIRYTMNCTCPSEVVSGKMWADSLISYLMLCMNQLSIRQRLVRQVPLHYRISHPVAIKIRHESLACTSWSTFSTTSLASSPGVIRVRERHHFDLPKHRWLQREQGELSFCKCT